MAKEESKRRNRIVAYSDDGTPIWDSRSIATETIVFHLIDGVWHVLANKRGPGCPNNKGLWNVPSGYLDYDEECEDCSKRETYEETGIVINRSDLNLLMLDSRIEPGDMKQNVIAVYWTVYDGPTTFSDSHSEMGEVSEIRWIPYSKLLSYDWVSTRHVARIIKAYNTYIANRPTGNTEEREYYGGC